MRVCLLTHALTPYELTGVENHTAQLAAAMARAGCEVQVFAPCPLEGTWRLAQRLEERDGYEIHWLALGERHPDEEGNEPGAAEAFGRYLDRERPSLVHAQHLVGLGPALVGEAKRRGIPFVFTAHDAWLVCEEYRLLRPDFVALDPADTDALGRVFLARRLLDRLLPEADHQGLVLKRDLNEEGHALLGDVLDGDPRTAGFEPEEIEGMRRRAELARSARLEALRAVDLVLSPTRFLAEVLRDGGVEAPLEVEPCGIDCGPFKDQKHTQRAAGAPLRVAFLGGVSKHKGLHDLLEAVDGLEGVALRVHGSSSDQAYSDRCRELALAAGAEWCGPFTHAELPGILSETDAVVVPSKWPENAPFVIREAFAAGVPVIAADVGAMRESVRDGVDGWLFPAGDVDALRARLRELALEEVTMCVEAPRSVDEQAALLLERYQGLAPRESDRPRARLEHLEDLTRRYEAAGDMTWRELVDRALRGYGSLCEELSPGALSTDRLMRAVATGSKLRERLAEGERARAWLGRVVDETRRSEVELDARARWQAESKSALAEEAGWLEEQLKAQREEVGAVTEARDAALQEREEAREERAQVATDLELASAEARWLKGQLEFNEGEVARLESERRGAVKDLEERARATEWLEGELAERDRRLAHAARKLEDAERARDAQREESEHRREVGERTREEAAWREEVLSAREEELAEERRRGLGKEQELAEERRRRLGTEEARAHLDAEVTWLRETHEALREEIAFLRGEVQAREEERARWAAQMESLTTQQERLLEHELWLRGELRRLLDAISGPSEELPAPEEIAERVSDAVEVLGTPEAEEER